MDSSNTMRLKFDGEGGNYFILILKNIFLTFITFGIYYFWANVNVKRFFYEHFQISGSRFGYHATGKERFIAFLKGIGILLILGIIFVLLGMIHFAVPYIIFIPAFLIMLPALTVAKMRFQLNRTSYSDIRFRFTGSPRELFFIYLKGIPLTIITLGIYLFWLEADLMKYFSRNIAIGSSRFGFQGKGVDLFIISLKGILLSIITLGIYYPWFYAEMTRYLVNNSQFQDTNLKCDLTGKQTFVTFLLNFLLMIVTLFIGTPWAIVNITRMIAGSIGLAAEIKTDELTRQDDSGANALADGLSDAMSFLESITDFIS